jgi:hypothetical protein
MLHYKVQVVLWLARNRGAWNRRGNICALVTHHTYMLLSSYPPFHLFFMIYNFIITYSLTQNPTH